MTPPEILESILENRLEMILENNRKLGEGIHEFRIRNACISTPPDGWVCTYSFQLIREEDGIPSGYDSSKHLLVRLITPVPSITTPRVEIGMYHLNHAGADVKIPKKGLWEKVESQSKPLSTLTKRR